MSWEMAVLNTRRDSCPLPLQHQPLDVFLVFSSLMPSFPPRTDLPQSPVPSIMRWSSTPSLAPHRSHVTPCLPERPPDWHSKVERGHSELSIHGAEHLRVALPLCPAKRRSRRSGYQMGFAHVVPC